jgi:hypothetical protein
LQRGGAHTAQIARPAARAVKHLRDGAGGTLVANARTGNSFHKALHMSTLWEMAETIRAEEAAALAAAVPARSRLRTWLAALRLPATATGGTAELAIVRRFPATRLASRKPGPSHLP